MAGVLRSFYWAIGVKACGRMSENNSCTNCWYFAISWLRVGFMSAIWRAMDHHLSQLDEGGIIIKMSSLY